MQHVLSRLLTTIREQLPADAGLALNDGQQTSRKTTKRRTTATQWLQSIPVANCRRPVTCLQQQQPASETATDTQTAVPADRWWCVSRAAIAAATAYWQTSWDMVSCLAVLWLTSPLLCMSLCIFRTVLFWLEGRNSTICVSNHCIKRHQALWSTELAENVVILWQWQGWRYNRKWVSE